MDFPTIWRLILSRNPLVAAIPASELGAGIGDR
jgi:hypothetical protein